METIDTYLPYLKGYAHTGESPVIIDFYASWCGPCRALGPVLEKFAAAYRDKVKVLKVDVDRNEALARAADIRSIPTLFFIDTNGNIERTVGGLSYQALCDKADALIRHGVRR